MNNISIDFSEIGDNEDFYALLKTKISQKEAPENLAELKSFIENSKTEPWHLELIEMSVDQLEYFEDLLEVLEELDDQLEHFQCSYFLEQFGE